MPVEELGRNQELKNRIFLETSTRTPPSTFPDTLVTSKYVEILSYDQAAFFMFLSPLVVEIFAFLFAERATQRNDNDYVRERQDSVSVQAISP